MNFASPGQGPESAPGEDSADHDLSIPGLDEADAFVTERLSDPHHPLVMFTIGTCSYCWAVRRFFRETGIEVCDLDLLTEEFAEGNRGARIRTVLRERTGARTLPQVFISGTPVGGAEELFEAFDEGRLAPLLDAAGISLDAADAPPRARDFLPNRPIAP